MKGEEMKEKIDAIDNKLESMANNIEKEINAIDADEKTKKKLKEQVKKEFESYKKDALEENIVIDDDKPLIQKIVFLLVGIVFFPVGYALYFLTKDNKRQKWQANYLVKGATVGLVLSLIVAVLDIVTTIVEGIVLTK